MFFGKKRNYFIDYFCKEMTTRTGECGEQTHSAIEVLVDATLAEARSKGWHKLDLPLGEAVLNPASSPSGQIYDFAAKTNAESSERWRAEGVTPSEVTEYWNHGFLSHLCYSSFDAFFLKQASVVALMDFTDEGRDFPDLDAAMDAAGGAVLKQWPVYGVAESAHLRLDEYDRPLPVEARLWVDRWRFRNAFGDPETFARRLAVSSTFNAEARRARASDPDLRAELAAHSLPAPVVGLGMVSEPVIVKDATDDEPEEDVYDYDSFIEVPNQLKWPIPVELDCDVRSAYRHLPETSEFITIPCVQQFPPNIQVSGFLNVAWLTEPDPNGVQLSADFVQYEDIRSGHGRETLRTESVEVYIVDATPAGYFHDSEFKTEGQGENTYHFQVRDLGLRLSASGHSRDFVIPWETGDLGEAEKKTIRKRLKAALMLIDRHLASGPYGDEDWL